MILLLLGLTLVHNTIGWQGHLVLHDDFDKGYLDRGLWVHDDNCYGKNIGSGNLQCFQKGKNLEVANGTLIIRARTDIYDSRMETIYTSAKIRTHGNGFRYGTYVIRARMPKGKHLIPSFWLQPIRQDQDTCSYEEMNVAEYRGQRTSTVIFSGAYGRSYDSSFGRTYERVFPGVDFSEDFHEFAMRWTPTRLQWFVDGKKTYEMTTHFRTDWTSGEKAKQPCSIRTDQALFSQESHFLISLGIGGKMFPSSKYGKLTRMEALKWPKPTLEIDSVYIYQD